MTASTGLFFKNRSFVLLAAGWAIMQVFLLYQYGVVTGYEATKYIAEADNFLNTGHYSTGNFLFYSTEIQLIVISKITSSFPWLPVVVQLVFNALSTVAFYRILLSLTGSKSRAAIATALLIAMVYYQLYNVHLFTESLYFSFGLLYTAGLFSIQRLNLKLLFAILTGLTVLYFTRPTGIFYFPATLAYIFFRFYVRQAWWLFTGSIAFGLAMFYALLNYAMQSGGEFNFLLPYIEEHVICGVPGIAIAHQITIPDQNSLSGLFYLITHHSNLFFSLAAKRLAAFWGVTRSYYSTTHNIFLGFYFFSAYLLIITGFRRLWRNFRPQLLFFLTHSLFVMVTVMLSCDEWHNRFILPLLPGFIILAFLAIARRN